MGCQSCAVGGCGSRARTTDTDEVAVATKTAGCSSGGCSSGGCNKLNSFDWLSDMLPSNAPNTRDGYTVVEVKFKGGRKDYFRNVHNLDLTTGDFVVCEMTSGYHLGAVSMQGDLVRLQLKRKHIQINDDTKVIQRVATQRDLEKHEQAILRDLPSLYRAREIVRDLKLQMKLSDVEFQSDNTKATFYYSSEERVDFRELIKMLASEFKVRVEMRQISLRQEAGRIGGLGSCGRELCCSTWLTDFKNITTSAARYQNLSLNPAKLSGQCGRLKCCLNYELDTYVDALRDIPTVDKPLETQKGRAFLQKTDIFRKIMWFGYSSESTWHPLPIARVLEIVALNKQGVVPESFDVLTPVGEKEALSAAALNADLTQLDKKYASQNRSSSSRRKKKKR
ncbi:PSP1 domain protein [Fibrella aestuarina BUZ 2]|uniref:PSP1 domain protein n=1 Tax=Fibrella aestuarina BUZ 2 TaxID=1166018 RepID=I0K2G3_9BACT|nr:PSP1 domain protein [Fibrella aestuarina BUZ 2]